MTSQELREKFLQFFKERGHAIIPSASLIPENDPTVLFTTAGMHPLVPFLMGEPHPGGKRLVDVQKCLRTDDINEVGDAAHLTFFEMLGNWSLGDYFKQEAIKWSFEFLTDKKWLGLDPKRLWVTVFAGDADAPYDEESRTVWEEQFRGVGIEAERGWPGKDSVEDARIFGYGKDKNWWGPVGQTGPCGPDTEMFYDTGCSHSTAYGSACHPNCECGRFVEIWNDVFMEYFRTAEGRYEPLKQKNVDTGMGLERTAAVLQSKATVFETDLFQAVIREIEKLSGKKYHLSRSPLDKVEKEGVSRAMRVIADHLRGATFILGDDFGVSPSNKDQGYIARRLIRRAVVAGTKLGIPGMFLVPLAEQVIRLMGGAYPELVRNRSRIIAELGREEEKFWGTLRAGLKRLEDIIARGGPVLAGDDAFELYTTYGFPFDLTRELVIEKSAATMRVDEEGFQKRFEEHQEISRAGGAGKFKGGLADHSAEVIRGHTGTHLLHMALRKLLGDEVMQKGSNITHERLRFDFTHPRKLTPHELKALEDMVNEQIKKDLPVRFEVLTVEEAKRLGAIGFFDDKYAQLGGKIKVYCIGDDKHGYFSKEICGGPHVTHTGEIGSFKITKEEAVGAGVRRIKATVG